VYAPFWITRSTPPLRPLLVLGRDVLGGEHDNGMLLQLSWRRISSIELEAVHLRHHQVQHDQAGRALAKPLEGDAAVLGLHDTVAVTFQLPAEQLPDRESSSTTSTGKSRRCFLSARGAAPGRALGQVLRGAQGIAEVPVVHQGQHDDGNLQRSASALSADSTAQPSSPA